MKTRRNAAMAGWCGRLLAVGLLVAGCEPIDFDRKSSSDDEASQTGDVPATGGAFDLDPVAWIGPTYSGVTRDERAVLHSASIDLGANVVRLAYDPLPGDWPRQVNAPGMLCLFEQLGDGSWRGGKFEWLDPGQTVKTLQNIDNGYNGWSKPASGARVAVVIFSTDGRRCTNPAYAVYQ